MSCGSIFRIFCPHHFQEDFLHGWHLLAERADFKTAGQVGNELTVADARGFCEFVRGQSAHRLHVVDFKERRHPIKAAACGLHLEDAAAIALTHLVDLATQGHLRLVDERDVVADVFNGRHVVGGEMMVAPSSRRRSISRLRISAFTGSKPEKGSSRITSCG